MDKKEIFKINNNEQQLKQHIQQEYIKKMNKLKLYKILWVKTITLENWNEITLEILKYRNWNIKHSLKYIKPKK